MMLRPGEVLTTSTGLFCFHRQTYLTDTLLSNILDAMSAETNARDYALGFYYWQSPIRLHEDMDEKSSQLRDLAELHKATNELIAQQARDLNEYEGMSWAQIGEVLGISKQTAHVRYAKKA